MKFIFWNIIDKDDSTIGKVIKDLVKYENPDILLLAESNMTDTFILNETNLQFISGITKTSFKLNKHLKLYSKPLNNALVTPVSVHGDGEILCCELEFNNQHFLIFGCHFVSKASLKDEDKRLKRFIKYKEFIESTESTVQNPPQRLQKVLSGSLAFGDFNVNPFERAMTDNTSLFALDITNLGPQKLKKRKYFINPTLSLLGNFGHRKNGKPSAPGTYYFKDKDIEIPSEHFWNILDGMFYRPELHNAYLKGEPLEVITEIKSRNGKIMHTLFDFPTMKINPIYSDHLPIKFKLDI